MNDREALRRAAMSRRDDEQWYATEALFRQKTLQRSIPTVHRYKPTGADIVADFCAERGVEFSTVLREDRHKPIVQLRHELFFRLRTETSLSLPQIGRLMKRDHASVFYGSRQHAERIGAAL